MEDCFTSILVISSIFNKASEFLMGKIVPVCDLSRPCVSWRAFLKTVCISWTSAARKEGNQVKAQQQVETALNKWSLSDMNVGLWLREVEQT